MPNYYRGIEFIGEGIEACWLNALELLESAKLVLNEKHHGLALSLAVLAMEEIGKLILIDGLLFAKPGDERSQIFDKGYRTHKVKLMALDIFPFLVTSLATLDPRYDKEQRFNQTLAIVIQQYKNQRQNLSPWLGPQCNLQDLDSWKQRGFYSHFNEQGRFVRPLTIDDNFSSAVVQLAFRIVNCLDFILKDNIERYKKRILSFRGKVNDQQLAQIRIQAQELVDQMFVSESEK